MLHLFETIKIKDDFALNLQYHQKRVSRYTNKIYLAPYIFNLSFPNEGIYRLRLDYTETDIFAYRLQTYCETPIRSLKLIIDPQIEYSAKRCDRSAIDALVRKKEHYDDILIIQDGLIQDTSFSNIVFFDGQHWITPKQPLLEGTCRARLLEKNSIISKDIYLDQLHTFDRFMLINALRDFDEAAAVHYSIDDRGNLIDKTLPQ